MLKYLLNKDIEKRRRDISENIANGSIRENEKREENICIYMYMSVIQ